MEEGLRLSDILEEKTDKGLTLSDIMSREGGLTLDEIKEPPFEVKREGGITEAMRKAIEAPEVEKSGLARERELREAIKGSEAYRVEQMKGHITPIQREQMRLDIAKEEEMEREAIRLEKVRVPYRWAAASLGQLERVFRGAAQLGYRGHGRIAAITGNEEVEKAAKSLENLFSYETQREVFAQKEEQRHLTKLAKEGRHGEAAIYAVTNASAETLQALLLLSTLPKVSPIPGMAVKSAKMGLKSVIGATSANASRLALWNFLTSPGSTKDRTKGALTTFAYMMTPALSGPLAGKIFGTEGVGAHLLAKGLDFLSNTGISGLVVKEYSEAYEEAKRLAIQAGDTEPGDWMKYIVRTGAVKTMVTDLISSLGTRPTGLAKVGSVNEKLIDLTSERVEQLMGEWDRKSQVRDVVEGQLEKAQYRVVRPGGERIAYGVEAEAGIGPEGEAPTFRGRVSQEYVNALNAQIRDTLEERGLSKKYLSSLKKQMLKGQKSLDAGQLSAVLNAVQRARPYKIKGERPITERTEKKIQSLSAILGATDKIGQNEVARLMVEEGIEGPPRFVDKDTHITEKDAKKLLSILNDEGEVLKSKIELERALDARPKLRQEWIRHKNESMSRTQRQMESGEAIKVSPFWDQDLMFAEMEAKTGKEFHRANADMADVRNDVEAEVQRDFMEPLQRIPGFDVLTKSVGASNRIRNYIESFLEKGKVPSPGVMTVAERAAADEMIRGFNAEKINVRETRFLESYRDHDGDVKAMKKDIPDASEKELLRAIDAYEYEGINALRLEISKPDIMWGTIDNGYAPRNTFVPRLMKMLPSMKKTTDYMLHTRRGIEFGPETDKHIFQQYESYHRQLMLTQRLAPHLRYMDRLWRRSAYDFGDPKEMEKRLTISFNEMKGYGEGGGWIGQKVRRLLSQVMSAVFLDPTKWVRNKLQNSAFYPWRQSLRDPRNRNLTPEERDYFHRRVSQKFGLLRHYMLGEEKPLPYVGRLADWARAVSLYPLTDETNRWRSYKASINRAERAMIKNPESPEGAMRDMGADFLEPLERARLLEVWSKEGDEGAKRYFATKVTDRVNFLYERWRRASVEHGPLGRTIMNLFTFPRSYTQRLYLQGRKAFKGKSHRAKFNAAKDIAGVMIIGTLIGEGFKAVTGQEWNPYNPATIIPWSPGGLSLGVPTEIVETLQAMLSAAEGDEQALDRAIMGMKRSADMGIPFFELMIDSIEGATGTRNIDLRTLRKMKEAVSEEYEVAEDRYEVERDFVEMVQHIFFGTKKKEEE